MNRDSWASVLLVSTAVFLIGIWMNAVPDYHLSIFASDTWADLMALLPGSNIYSWIVSVHNVHLVLPTRALSYLDVRLFGGGYWLTTVVSSACLSGIPVLMLYARRLENRQQNRFFSGGCVLVVTAFLFSPLTLPIAGFAYFSQHVFVTFAVLLVGIISHLVASRWPSLSRLDWAVYVAALTGACVLAVVSSGQGVAGAVLALAIVLALFSVRNGIRLNGLVLVLGLMVAFSVSIYWWLAGGEIGGPASHSSKTYFSILVYGLTGLGLPVYYLTGSESAALWFGLALLIISAVAALVCVRSAVYRAIGLVQTLSIVMIGFAVISMAAIAVTRADTGWAVTDVKYNFYSLTLIAFLLVFWIDIFSHTNVGRLVLGASVTAGVAVFVLSWPAAAKERLHYNWLDSHSPALFLGARDGEVLEALSAPDLGVDAMLERARFLGVGPFGSRSFSAFRSSLKVERRWDDCQGHVEGFRAVKGSAPIHRIQGWGIGGPQRADSLPLFVIVQGSGQVVGFGSYVWPRPDVARWARENLALTVSQTRRIGWIAYVLSEYKSESLEVWQVDMWNATGCRLVTVNKRLETGQHDGGDVLISNHDP